MYRLYDLTFDYNTRTDAVIAALQALNAFYFPRIAEIGIPETRKLPEFDRLLRAYQDADAAAYPDGFWNAFRRVHAADPILLEPTLQFLRANPRIFRATFINRMLLRRVKQWLPLTTDTQKHDLQEVVLRAVDTTYRRDFRELCRLALQLDNPAFRAALRSRLNSSDPHIVRRAGWVLTPLEW